MARRATPLQRAILSAVATWIAIGILASACTGCVATPTPDNPARCSVGTSGSHTHGRSDGWGNSEEFTTTVWAECSM